MESLWTKDVDQVPLEALTQIVFERRKSDCSIYSGILSSSGVRITMKVLTVESAAACQRFLQEAALLKILNHRSIATFAGLATLPPYFTEVKESGQSDLPVIITQQSQSTSLSLYLDTLPQKKSSRRSRKIKYPYNDILDILIDVADALQYLHSRHPAVVHRGVSVENISVVRTETGIRGELDDLSTALLSAGSDRRIKRLGIESFLKGALNSEDLLSVDFFKEPSICTPSNPISPRHVPRLPILTSSVIDKQLKKSKRSSKSVAPIQLKDKTPKKTAPSPKATYQPPNSPVKSPQHRRPSKNSSVAPTVRVIAQVEARAPSKALEPVATPVLRPLEIMDVVIEEDEPTEAVAEKLQAQEETQRHPAVIDSPSAFPSRIASSIEQQRADSDPRSATKAHAYDSASSSRSNDHTSKSKAEIKTVEQGRKFGEIPFGKRPADLPSTDSYLSPDLSTKDAEDKISRANSLVYLKGTQGLINLAPEILNGGPYGTPSDVFSFGIVIFTALTRRTPSELTGKPGLEFFFPEGFASEVQSLVIDCCNVRPQSRPKIRTVQERLRLIKESGCLNTMTQKKRRRFACFGRHP